jgi:N-acetylglucosamine-6-phosphate deacetylase
LFKSTSIFFAAPIIQLNQLCFPQNAAIQSVASAAYQSHYSEASKKLISRDAVLGAKHSNTKVLRAFATTQCAL